MGSIPIHMRITKLAVTDDEVNKMQAAISDLVVSWRRTKNIDELLTRASEIAETLSGDGTPPPMIAAEIEAVVQKHASAFLQTESPLTIGVVAGMALVDLLKPTPTGDWTVSEVLATAVWSALSYLPAVEEPKRDSLRGEVLRAAERRSLAAAEIGRKRRDVPNFNELEIVESEEGKTPTNFMVATAATIDALRHNAALDREELDFLWWSQIERSLGRPRMSMAEPVRVVAAGIEGAAYLRRLPCDVHRDIVLRTLDKDPELDLKKLLHAIGADCAALSASCEGDYGKRWPTVFPFLAGLATGDAKRPGDQVKRKASEWGCRALLEAGLAHIIRTGNAKL